MNKKLPLYSVIILVTLAIVVTFNTTYLAINRKHNKELNDVLMSYGMLDQLLALDEVVRKNYIGEIDDEELKAAIIRGYLSGIGDKYSTYMTSDEYATYTEEMNGNAVGIGVNVIYDSITARLEILSVIPESPAEEVGILAGDLIVAVEGQAIADIGYYSALDIIKGDEGTTVNLTLYRKDHEYTVTCVRKAMTLQSVTYHAFSDDASVGVIRISEFNGTTPDQFSEAVESLKTLGCTKFVFDLRNNGGGELTSVLDVLDQILPEGPLAHVYYQTGDTKHYDSDAEFLDASVAVLVNGNTASAAELFASALRDYNAEGLYDAVVVGTKTYGKGVFQRFYKMSDGSAFKISCGRYDPPYAENYDGIGITPDIIEDLSEEAKEIGFYKLTDQNDNQLIRAVNQLK